MKEVLISKGMIAIVDDDDFEAVTRNKWSAMCADGIWYARRGLNRNNQVILMHRQIMRAPNGVYVDHANGNGLDNRKENLRFATNAQNMANHRRLPTASGFIGVSWDKNGRKWRARVGGKPELYAGMFVSAEEAARARDRLALATYGSFARLNFPTDTGEIPPGVSIERTEGLKLS